MTAPQGPTVYQEKVSSCVQQDTTVLVAVLRVSCPALLAHTAQSLASAKWSSASFVQQVRVLSYGCFHRTTLMFVSFGFDVLSHLFARCFNTNSFE